MPNYDDYLKILMNISESRRGKRKMNNEGPYRESSVMKAIEDHDGRLATLEYFAEGRVKCDGSELWKSLRSLRFDIKGLRVSAAVVALALAAWILIDLLTMEGLHKEQEQKIDQLETRIVMQELEIKSLKSALKCISEHSYKIAEVRDSL